MGLLDSVTRWFLGPEPEIQERSDSVLDLVGRLGYTRATWRPMSIAEAISVPSIQRAISLISGTTGMMSVQGYRRGAVLAETPRLLARPDPNNDAWTFYSSTAYCMAAYGEFVWYIAHRDGDGLADALVAVPLNELHVDENSRNRLYPVYEWGQIQSTRWSPGNDRGRFVHKKYPLTEPFALRGKGPLQLCGAAVTVAVEAQEWAANFYADGGAPGVTVKVGYQLDATLDADGLSEADRLRAQWIDRHNNGTRIIDTNIDSVDYQQPNPQGAQMLDARSANNGDAARMFGIPGSMMEYAVAGSSLTYQNVGQELDKFTRVCLQPFYLEPIEQAMSDLLPRSTTARFNVKGLLRADIKTRFEVHGIAIDKGIYDAEEARRIEGLDPGDVEFAPVLFAPPAAIPAVLPIQQRSELREVRCHRCARLVGRVGGPAELYCRHCKEQVVAA
jgi:HK97 family phage portal protein